MKADKIISARTPEQFPLFSYLLKWLLISALIGAITGSASAFFLTALNQVTQWRDDNMWLIAALPLAGLIIGLVYHYFGKEANAGNNLLLDEYYQPRKTIPFRMAPLVLFGTLLTHLAGGSAGREGTAVQMGGALADQFTRLLRLSAQDRKLILIAGISGGFASVFGTPLAGAVFALEVLIVGRMRYEALIPAFLTATVADYTCTAWQVHHTEYFIPSVPEISPETLLWCIPAGIAFGLAALLFTRMSHFFSSRFQKYIAYAPLRPVAGGVLLAAVMLLSGNTRYAGLGIPVISESFLTEVYPWDFMLKTLFTTFTLGAGFKGGEVTPLFFIGATLGNTLGYVIPLPLALLAGMGFTAVFAGATNTPIACTLMGLELFGTEAAVFIALACVIAYLFSGHSGIYSSQVVGSAKYPLFSGYKSKSGKSAREK